MSNVSLDSYDCIPPAMRAYLRTYGKHFNKKLYEFAVSKMRRRDGQGASTKV